MNRLLDMPIPSIDPTWSVNETLLRVPRAAVVFDAFGVDACCGGTASLAQAARDARVALDDLLLAITHMTEQLVEDDA